MCTRSELDPATLIVAAAAKRNHRAGEDDQAGVVWRKSTLSTTNGCVEVAVVGDRIAVRDSKQEGRGPVLEFTAVEWEAFVGGVRGGEFDLSPGR